MSTGAFNITSPASARDTSDGLQLVDTNDGKNTRVNEQKGEHTYLPGAVENNEKSESVIGLSAVESFHLRAQQIVGWHIYDISQFLNQYNVNYTGVFSATDTSPFLRRLAPFSSTSFSSLASESIQSVRLYDEELNTITQFDANLVHSSPPSQETGKVEEERRTLVKRWSRQIDSNRGDVGEGGNYTDVLQLLLDQLTISDRNNKSMNGDDTRNSKGLTHTQAMRIADQALQFVYALKCRSDLEQEKGACWSVWKATSKILSSQLKQLSSLHLHLQHPIAQKESGHNDDSRNCSHHHHQPTHIHNRYKNQNYGHSIRHADNIDTHNPHLHHISGVSIGARGLEVGASGVQSSNHNTNDIGNNNNGHGDEGKAFREKMKGATNSNNTTQNCVKRKGDGLFSSSKSMANKSRAQSIHIDDADNEGEGGEAEMHRKMRRMYGDTSHSENDPNQAASVKLNDGSGSGKGSYSNKKEHGGEGSYGKGKDVSEHRVRNFKSVFVNHTDESDSNHNNGSATSLDRNGKSSGNHGQNNVNIHHASDQGNDAHHHEPSDEDRIMNVRTKAMISNQSDHEDSIPRFKHCLQRFFPPSLYDGYVIEPTNIYLVYWEVVVICVISIFYLQTPMDLAFRYNSSNLDLYSGSINAPYLLSYIILHIVLWVDNLLMLFLAYRTKSGEVSGLLELRQHVIAYHYLTSYKVWFGILTSIPFDIFVVDPDIRFILRCLKLLTVGRLNDILSNRSHYSTLNPVSFEFIRLFGSLLLYWHWTGCGYWRISMAEELGSDSWVPSIIYEDETASFKYLLSLFWAIAATTGMMENSPVTYVECLFTIFSIGTGVIIYAYILSAATNALRNMNSVEDEASQKFQRVQMYLNQKKIPQPLQMKIKDYYDYINSRTFNHSDVLDGLHYRLRSELNYHTHISLVKKVPCFRGVSRLACMSLINMLSSVVYIPGEYVIVAGELGDEMFFVARGRFRVFLKASDVNASIAASNKIDENDDSDNTTTTHNNDAKKPINHNERQHIEKGNHTLTGNDTITSGDDNKNKNNNNNSSNDRKHQKKKRRKSLRSALRLTSSYSKQAMAMWSMKMKADKESSVGLGKGTQFVHKSAVKTPSFSSFHDAASSSFGHFHRRSDQNPNSLSAPQKSRFHLGSIVESEQGDGDDNKTNDEGASVELARMGEGMEVDSGDDDDDWDLSKYGMSESDDEDYRDEVVKINDDDVELNVLSTGDYFGEMAILTECKRTASVASVGYGELLLLTRSDVEVLTGMFPNFTSALMAFAPDKIKGGHATTKLLQSE